MNSREVVRRTIRFQNPERLALDLPEPWGSDFARTGMSPSPDTRPRTGRDEWGALWNNVGVCKLGEVVEPAVADWADFGRLRIPDVREERRWEAVRGARERAGDKFLICGGLSLYERAHFIRGLQNLWMDIRLEPENIEKLLDILVDQNLYAIERYAQLDADGYMFCDDWGLQDKLMIAPADWRRFWKPRYARVYAACHEAGLMTLLHSCGHIVDILDDLIEIGLDVIQMDQQENMGLEKLAGSFGGKLCFWCPVDIQNTMIKGSVRDVRNYAVRLMESFGRFDGGFIAKWYPAPEAAGHSWDKINAMSDTFAYYGSDFYSKK